MAGTITNRREMLPIQRGVAYHPDIVVRGLDLSQYDEVRCQLKVSHDTADIALDMALVTTPIAINGNQIEIRLTDDETASVPEARYVYKIELFSAGECLFRLLDGAWDVIP